MANNYLTTEQATDLVENYIQKEEAVVSVQELLDGGAIPRLQGYSVRPGKVSDSIFGGVENYLSKETGNIITFRCQLISNIMFDAVFISNFN